MCIFLLINLVLGLFAGSEEETTSDKNSVPMAEHFTVQPNQRGGERTWTWQVTHHQISNLIFSILLQSFCEEE